MTEDSNAPQVPDHVDKAVRSVAQLHSDHHGRTTSLQRAVNRVAARMGRPWFIGFVGALSDNKSQKYVSISGHAEMSDDRERVKKYWSVYDKAFWSDKNDPRIRVLRVTPESAEFWEGSGKVVTAVKLIAAIASGQRMDHLGENEKVGFPQGGKLAG